MHTSKKRLTYLDLSALSRIRTVPKFLSSMYDIVIVIDAESIPLHHNAKRWVDLHWLISHIKPPPWALPCFGFTKSEAGGHQENIIHLQEMNWTPGPWSGENFCHLFATSLGICFVFGLISSHVEVLSIKQLEALHFFGSLVGLVSH